MVDIQYTEENTDSSIDQYLESVHAVALVAADQIPAGCSVVTRRGRALVDLILTVAALVTVTTGTRVSITDIRTRASVLAKLTDIHT